MSKNLKQLADVEAEIIHQTDAAFLLYDGKVKEWVPKSQVEDNGDGTFTMPERVAKEKGFI